MYLLSSVYDVHLPCTWSMSRSCPCTTVNLFYFILFYFLHNIFMGRRLAWVLMSRSGPLLLGFIYLFVCLFIYLFIYLFTFLFSLLFLVSSLPNKAWYKSDYKYRYKNSGLRPEWSEKTGFYWSQFNKHGITVACVCFRASLKRGSHLCDKHKHKHKNNCVGTGVSKHTFCISASTRKWDFSFLLLELISRLCLFHKWKPAWVKHKHTHTHDDLHAILDPTESSPTLLRLRIPLIVLPIAQVTTRI